LLAERFQHGNRHIVCTQTSFVLNRAWARECRSAFGPRPNAHIGRSAEVMGDAYRDRRPFNVGPCAMRARLRPRERDGRPSPRPRRGKTVAACASPRCSGRVRQSKSRMQRSEATPLSEKRRGSIRAVAVHHVRTCACVTCTAGLDGARLALTAHDQYTALRCGFDPKPIFLQSRHDRKCARAGPRGCAILCDEQAAIREARVDLADRSGRDIVVVRDDEAVGVPLRAYGLGVPREARPARVVSNLAQNARGSRAWFDISLGRRSGREQAAE
jgi:hypothetical protein